MIPSCNNRFAKVKFRLKKMKLETIFNSCPERILFRGNYPRGNCPGGNFHGGQLSGGSYPGGELSLNLSFDKKIPA